MDVREISNTNTIQTYIRIELNRGAGTRKRQQIAQLSTLVSVSCPRPRRDNVAVFYRCCSSASSSSLTLSFFGHVFTLLHVYFALLFLFVFSLPDKIRRAQHSKGCHGDGGTWGPKTRREMNASFVQSSCASASLPFPRVFSSISHSPVWLANVVVVLPEQFRVWINVPHPT